MELVDAVRTVYGSTAEQWAYFEGLDCDPDLSHTAEATNIEDVLLTLRWGRRCITGYREPWTERFADQAAHSFYVDLVYAGSLVEREILVSVDGGRYCLPVPNIVTTDDGAVEFHVTMKQEALARLVHDLTHVAETLYAFDHGMETGGLKAVP